MRCERLDEFKREISLKKFSIFLILAKEKEEGRQLLQMALSFFPAPTLILTPETFTSSLFVQEVETLPFLTDHRIVVVDSLDELPPPAIEVIHHYLLKPSPQTILFLLASSLSSQNKIMKEATAKGIVFQIPEEKPWEKEERIAHSLIEQAGAAQVRLSATIATQLVKMVDPSTLYQEIEKLICFVGTGGEITLDAIRKICTLTHQKTLWQLGEAIFSRDVKESLEIGTYLMDDGVAIFPIMSHLRSQIHSSQEILAVLEQGGKVAVTKAFPYLKGKLLEKKIGLLTSYGQERMSQALLHLFNSELQAKNSSTDAKIILEIFLLRGCA